MQVKDPYIIASKIGKADISALPPEKIAAAIRESRTILAAWSGSAEIMRRVYSSALAALCRAFLEQKDSCFSIWKRTTLYSIPKSVM